MGIVKHILKTNIREELQETECSEDVLDTLVEDALGLDEPAYICRTRDELSSALQQMSEI